MTFTDPPTVHVRTTTDLLALIPFLLGFHLFRTTTDVDVCASGGPACQHDEARQG